LAQRRTEVKISSCLVTHTPTRKGCKVKVLYCIVFTIAFQITFNLRMSCFIEYYDVYCRSNLSLVHTNVLSRRTRVQSTRMSPDCPCTVRRHFFFGWGDSVCCLPARMESSRQSQQVWTCSRAVGAHCYFLQGAILLFVEFERLTCPKKEFFY
jgi:hypothetical protein